MPHSSNFESIISNLSPILWNKKCYPRFTNNKIETETHWEPQPAQKKDETMLTDPCLRCPFLTLLRSQGVRLQEYSNINIELHSSKLCLTLHGWQALRSHLLHGAFPNTLTPSRVTVPPHLERAGLYRQWGLKHAMPCCHRPFLLCFANGP